MSCALVNTLVPDLSAGSQQTPPSSPQQIPNASAVTTTTTTARRQPLNTATASTCLYTAHDLAVENIMSGIYLTKNFIAWNEENLRLHGFTHIIIIDKHIQELYYPSPIFKLSNSLETSSPFDEYLTHSPLKFGKEFEAIDLNFGEKSYLTTVLPNCYRAVKFIYKALQNGGSVLVIDCNGGEQKCVTIVVAYLMYKHNLNFRNAFARLKEHYKKADLDRFFMSQLYEYEPILQVQRAQSRGHSCSRDLNSSILKRKKSPNDTDSTKFFVTLNPLTQFNAMEIAQEYMNNNNNNNNCNDTTDDYLTKLSSLSSSQQQLHNNRTTCPSTTWSDLDFMDQ